MWRARIARSSIAGLERRSEHLRQRRCRDQLPSKTTLVRSTLHGCRTDGIDGHSAYGPPTDILPRSARSLR
jgi:hypothetical protein